MEIRYMKKSLMKSDYDVELGMETGIVASYLVGITLVFFDKSRTKMNKLMNSILMLATSSALNVILDMYVMIGLFGRLIKYVIKIFGISGP